MFHFQRMSLCILAVLAVSMAIVHSAFKIDSLIATASGSTIIPSILCVADATSSGSPDTNQCANRTSLFPTVTVKAVNDFPADLTTFDLIAIASNDSTVFDSLASQLNPYVNGGGGLVAGAQNFTPGVQPLPPGLEVQVADVFWPGAPLSEPPVAVLTSAGASHPILHGSTDEEWWNGSVIPINTLCSPFAAAAKPTLIGKQVRTRNGSNSANLLALHPRG